MILINTSEFREYKLLFSFEIVNALCSYYHRYNAQNYLFNMFRFREYKLLIIDISSKRYKPIIAHPAVTTVIFI